MAERWDTVGLPVPSGNSPMPLQQQADKGFVNREPFSPILTRQEDIYFFLIILSCNQPDDNLDLSAQLPRAAFTQCSQRRGWEGLLWEATDLQHG